LDQDLQRDLQVALDLARRAGDGVRRYFRTELVVDHKAGDEPVTRADRESQAVILEGLERHSPQDGILAEEEASHGRWRGRRRIWVVDPLDGTKDFVSGRTGFAVMIGLLEDFCPVLGVVHDPLSGLTYAAVRGGGATLIRGEERTALQTSAATELKSLRLVVSRSHRSPRIDQVKQTTGITDEQNVGSVGLKVGLIARGERDLYLNPEGHCKLWDVCAPEVILTEAGGRMTDIHGDPMRYDPAQVRVEHGVLASNGACHAVVLQAIAPIFPRATV
jgi:3'(2'), 5'-bisphosphate nucleotidase